MHHKYYEQMQRGGSAQASGEENLAANGVPHTAGEELSDPGEVVGLGEAEISHGDHVLLQQWGRGFLHAEASGLGDTAEGTLSEAGDDRAEVDGRRAQFLEAVRTAPWSEEVGGYARQVSDTDSDQEDNQYGSSSSPKPDSPKSDNLEPGSAMPQKLFIETERNSKFIKEVLQDGQLPLPVVLRVCDGVLNLRGYGMGPALTASLSRCCCCLPTSHPIILCMCRWIQSTQEQLRVLDISGNNIGDTAAEQVLEALVQVYPLSTVPLLCWLLP